MTSMEARAKVAVITRTRDRPLMLARAVRSVSRQTFSDWVMVIVDDGGERGAVERVVREHPPELRDRIRIVGNAVPRGRGSSCNRGIESSESDYIAVHDDDDSWEPGFLARCVSAMESAAGDGRIGGVVSQAMRIEESIVGDEIVEDSRMRYEPALEGLVPFSQILARNLFQPIAFLYSRSAHEGVGLYDESLLAAEDWEFNIRFLRRYDILALPEVLANYHVRPRMTGGPYGNSVIAERETHRKSSTGIANALLREDLDAGRFGVGAMMVLLKGLRRMEKRIDEPALRADEPPKRGRGP
jgi:glycosyltransferase involved in cell wall biosynthesis